MDTFDFQWSEWKKHSSISPSHFQSLVTDFLSRMNLCSDFFSNKTILDAGCGIGRYTLASAMLGAHVVAIDLVNSGIHQTRQFTKKLPNVDCVQGDLLHSPFKFESFDFVFSVGVLHHSPNPQAAFERIARLVRRDGLLYIWVYRKRSPLLETMNVFLRTFTARLPLRFLYALSFLLIPFASVIVGYKLGVHGTFDWCAPKYQHHFTEQEVLNWYEKMGFKEVKLVIYNKFKKCGFGVIGHKSP